MKRERSKGVQDECKELNVILESNLDEGREDMERMRGHKKVHLKELKTYGSPGTGGGELDSQRVGDGGNRK